MSIDDELKTLWRVRFTSATSERSGELYVIAPTLHDVHELVDPKALGADPLELNERQMTERRRRVESIERIAQYVEILERTK